jgi:hypothetical protein
MRRESHHHAREEWEREEASDLLPAEGELQVAAPAEVAAPAVSQNAAACSGSLCLVPHLVVVAPSSGST